MMGTFIALTNVQPRASQRRLVNDDLFVFDTMVGVDRQRDRKTERWHRRKEHRVEKVGPFRRGLVG